MSIWIGDIQLNSTIYFKINTYDANGASVTASNLAASDIEIYKNGSTTQRASDNGYTVTVGFDSNTGFHEIKIDLSDNSDSGFYAIGAWLDFYVGPFTVDSQTVHFSFSGRLVAADGVAGYKKVDVAYINGVATSSVTTVNANVGTTQPVNFTGTGASAVVKSQLADGVAHGGDTATLRVDIFNIDTDLTVGGDFQATNITLSEYFVAPGVDLGQDFGMQISGAITATNASNNIKGIDLKYISGDQTAADNAESFFDGTGYAGTNNVIPTVTTLTNAPPDSAGVTTLLSRIPSALFSGITSLAQWLGLIAGKQTGNSTARTEIRATGAGSGTYDEATDSQEALRDNTGTAGAGLTQIDLPDQTMNITGNITGSLSGSVGSVSGNVGGNVAGSVGSVTSSVTVGTNNDKTGYSVTGLTPANLDVAVSTRLASASYTAPPSAAQNATELLDQAAGVETSWTVRQLFRLVLGWIAGGSSGNDTGHPVHKNPAGNKNRVQADVDEYGNRTNVTTDVS